MFNNNISNVTAELNTTSPDLPSYMRPCLNSSNPSHATIPVIEDGKISPNSWNYYKNAENSNHPRYSECCMYEKGMPEDRNGLIFGKNEECDRKWNKEPGFMSLQKKSKRNGNVSHPYYGLPFEVKVSRTVFRDPVEENKEGHEVMTAPGSLYNCDWKTQKWDQQKAFQRDGATKSASVNKVLQSEALRRVYDDVVKNKVSLEELPNPNKHKKPKKQRAKVSSLDHHLMDIRRKAKIFFGPDWTPSVAATDLPDSEKHTVATPHNNILNQTNYCGAVPREPVDSNFCKPLKHSFTCKNQNLNTIGALGKPEEELQWPRDRAYESDKSYCASNTFCKEKEPISGYAGYFAQNESCSADNTYRSEKPFGGSSWMKCREEPCFEKFMVADVPPTYSGVLPTSSITASLARQPQKAKTQNKAKTITSKQMECHRVYTSQMPGVHIQYESSEYLHIRDTLDNTRDEEISSNIHLKSHPYITAAQEFPCESNCECCGDYPGVSNNRWVDKHHLQKPNNKESHCHTESDFITSTPVATISSPYDVSFTPIQNGQQMGVVNNCNTRRFGPLKGDLSPIPELDRSFVFGSGKVKYKEHDGQDCFTEE